MGVGGRGIDGEEGVSVGGGTLGVLVGIGVSVAVGPGVKVGLGVLVGVGAGVGALAISEVSGQPRHPNALPKTNTAMRITNRDLFITMLFSFSSQTVWPAPINSSASLRVLRNSNCSGLKSHSCWYWVSVF
jgi:hypothetical protein